MPSNHNPLDMQIHKFTMISRVAFFFLWWCMVGCPRIHMLRAEVIIKLAQYVWLILLYLCKYVLMYTYVNGYTKSLIVWYLVLFVRVPSFVFHIIICLWKKFYLKFLQRVKSKTPIPLHSHSPPHLHR